MERGRGGEGERKRQDIVAPVGEEDVGGSGGHVHLECESRPHLK